MNRSLTLAPNLSLPINIAGQTVAVFGIRGSGKTNTATVLAEELLIHGHTLAVIDPTDAWWGLRAGRDGSQALGHQILIAGGSHGDIPLQETDGKVLAEFLVQEQMPIILSLRHLRKNAQRRFVTDFCEELYHLKGDDKRRTPLTVIIDEAPLFAPQKVMGEMARTVGAVEDLIARGRNVGFGVVLISQRSATLNADVRTQADTIICHRLIGKLDRKAISEWFEENASVDRLKEILQSLATLQDGECWVWSPRLDVMVNTRIRMRRTFNSSATPEIGQVIRPPKSLREIDLNRLKGQLAATIEKTKADDPKQLRKQIDDLSRKVRELEARKPEATKPLEIPILTDKDRELLRGVGTSLTVIAADIDSAKKIADTVIAICNKAANLPNHVRPAPTPQIRARPLSPAPTRKTSAKNGKGADLGKCERAILQVLSQFDDGCNAGKLTLLTGYRYSGGFKNALSMLRQSGLIQGSNTDVIRITAEGMAEGPFEPLPAGQELINYWLTHRSFGVCERKILAELVEHRSGLTADQLCERTGYQYSGGFKNALSNLRTAGVLVGRNTDVMQASETLFE